MIGFHHAGCANALRSCRFSRNLVGALPTGKAYGDDGFGTNGTLHDTVLEVFNETF